MVEREARDPGPIKECRAKVLKIPYCSLAVVKTILLHLPPPPIPNAAQQFLKKLIKEKSRITCDNRLPYFAFSNDSFYVSLSYLPNEAELSLQKEQQHNQRSDEWHWLYRDTLDLSIAQDLLIHKFVINVEQRNIFHIFLPNTRRSKQYMNPAGALFTIESHWLSGGASERRIRRSEVRFWVRTQFFFVPSSWQNDNTTFGIQVLSKQGKHQLFPKYEIRAVKFKKTVDFVTYTLELNPRFLINAI